MLADYYSRSALAAAQILEGFNEAEFRSHLETTTVGVSAGTPTAEAEAVLDLSVRLVARLYPNVAIRATPEVADRLGRLAKRINPNIEIEDNAELGLVV